MKLTLPSATLTALLSSGEVLSKDQNIGLVTTEPAKKVREQGTKAEIKVDHDIVRDVDWNDGSMSMRLKEKLKARLDLRNTMRSRGVQLFKTDKECRPTAGFDELGKDALTDVGIFGCVDSDICVRDSASLLGGLCARVDKGGDTDAENSKQLQPLTVRDKLKAKTLLEEQNTSEVGPSGVVGEECVPSTSEGYVDVGVLNPCEHSGHVCMKDPLSALGGTCVGINGGSYSSYRNPEEDGAVSRRLNACRYQNGTFGLKCSARGACRGLSQAFIEKNIGCGSCNGFGSCVGMPGQSCRYGSELGGFGSSATITISDQSCNEYYACSYITGTAIIDHDSCNGVYACMGLKGTSSIGMKSCDKDNACKYMSGNTTIDSKSCSNCLSCSGTSGVTTIGSQSCNGLKSCSSTSGTTTISDSSCSGQYSCSSSSGATLIGNGSCSKAHSCKNLSGQYTFIGNSACIGELACSYASSPNMTVLDNACTNTSACSRASGNYIMIEQRSCQGNKACSDALADYIVLKQGACSATYACENFLISGDVYVGRESCSIINACRNVAGSTRLGNNSCLGAYACSDTSGNLTVRDGSCIGTDACRFTEGKALIYPGSCQGYKACSEAKKNGILTAKENSCTEAHACSLIIGDALIHEGSCNGSYACNNVTGSVFIGNGSCTSANTCGRVGQDGNLTVFDNSCTLESSCSYIYNKAVIYSGSCHARWGCADVFGRVTVRETSCNSERACRGIKSNTFIDEKSCNDFLSCSEMHGTIKIGSDSCNSAYACSKLWGNTTILTGSCSGSHSCSDLVKGASIGADSCLDPFACQGSGAIIVRNDSCVGDNSCSFTKGFTQIDSFSCIGVNACAGLTLGTISVSACQGVGACSRPVSTQSWTPTQSPTERRTMYAFPSLSPTRDPATYYNDYIDNGPSFNEDNQYLSTKSTLKLSRFIAGSNSCNGCYACINGTGSVTVGHDSCLGFSACGAIAGNVTIANNSCYGLKACSNITNTSTVLISNGACIGAQSCMLVSGYSAVLDESCKGPQACKEMQNGNVSYNSCAQRGACSKLQGSVGSFSCQGYFSCSSAGGVSSNEIGRNSCNAAKACQNNSAHIGDCLCLTYNECIDNKTPLHSDGCAPSLSPAPSSSLAPSNSPSSSEPSVSANPSDNPSSSPSMCDYRKVQKIKIQSTTTDMIQMFEVNVMSHDGLNIALGKSANQSSTFLAKSGMGFEATLAVDGNNDTFSHTATADSSSWWEVNLGGINSGEISSIEILNRWCGSPRDKPGCLCRLSDATVSMVDENDVVIASDSTSDTCDVAKVELNLDPCKPSAPTKSPALASESCFPHARKVKLQKATSGAYIQLFELRAMSTMGINVAQGKTASQSSTFSSPYGGSFSASRAIDGNTASFSHTGSNDTQPWLEIDLGSIYEISSVQLLNRWCKTPSDPPKCLCRLSGAILSLVDDFGEEITSTTVGNTCGLSDLEFIFDQSPEFCQDPTTSPTKSSSPSSSPSTSLMPSSAPTVLLAVKFVKISLYGFDRIINLVEVQVYDNKNKNRALRSSGAIAKQSTTFKSDNSLCRAFIAIDGNTAENATRVCNGISRTDNKQRDAWWQVELRYLSTISRVVIHNTRSHGPERLSHATVTLLDDKKNIIGQVLDIGNTKYMGAITLRRNDFTDGSQLAVFDDGFGAPHCNTSATSCDTRSLVISRGSMEPEEANLPNTIDGCADGSYGSYYSDESLERIVLRSGEVDEDDSDEMLFIGGRATIVATVFVYSDVDDLCDFFYANDASNPLWNYIGTLQPEPAEKLQQLKMAFTIPYGSETQAVRVQFRYYSNETETETPEPCIDGEYNDRDDLVFTTAPYPSTSPSVSLSPSISVSPSLWPTDTSSPSATPSASPSLWPTNTPSLSPSVSASPSLWPTDTPSLSPSVSASPSLWPTDTPSPSASMTPTVFLPAAKFVKISLSGERTINIFEVQVFDNTNTNRAIGSAGAIATQIATYLWYDTPCNASIAIDGNTVEDATQPCYGLAHTGFENEDPWWQVEMLGTYRISSIVIYNRISYGSERLSHATVTLLDANGKSVGRIVDIGDTTKKQVITLNSDDLDDSPSASPTAPPTFSLSPSVSGRPSAHPTITSAPSTSALPTVRLCFPNVQIVKLQLFDTTEFIQLFELQIMDKNGVNVAIGKAASQSSTYYENGVAMSASRAVDSDLSTFSHTNGGDQNPWLQIDLGSSGVQVKSIVIHNRWCIDPNDPNKCLCRLSQAILSLTDPNGAVIGSYSTGNTCAKKTVEFNFSAASEFCLVEAGSLANWALVWHKNDHAEGLLFHGESEARYAYDNAVSSMWAQRLIRKDGVIVEQYGWMSDKFWCQVTDWADKALSTGILPVQNAYEPDRCFNPQCDADVCTPDDYTKWFPFAGSLGQTGQMDFEVKGNHDAHIALGSSSTQLTGRQIKDHYEVVIGGWGNSYSELRLVSNLSMKNGDVATGCVGVGGSPLSVNEFRKFRLDWSDTRLILSRWNGNDFVSMLELDISSKKYEIDRALVMTGYGGSFGEWNLISTTVASLSPSLSSMPSAHPTITSAPSTVCFPIVKKVKLQLFDTTNYIHVFELQVIDETGKNIAAGKVATQSSTYYEKGKAMAASHAVDSKLSTYSQTNKGDQNPWLEIDLGKSSKQVKSIIIHNRWCNNPDDLPRCLCRLSEATLSLTDHNGAAIASYSTGNTCAKEVVEFNIRGSPKFCLTEAGLLARHEKQLKSKAMIVRKLGSKPCKPG